MNNIKNLALIVLYIVFSVIIFGYADDITSEDSNKDVIESIPEDYNDDIIIEDAVNFNNIFNYDYIKEQEEKLTLKDNVRVVTKDKSIISIGKTFRNKHIPIEQKLNIYYALYNRDKYSNYIYNKNIKFDIKNPILDNITNDELITEVITLMLIPIEIKPRAPGIIDTS